MRLYERFDEAICQKLNDKWRNGKFLDNGTTEGGKERSLLLRLSVSLFVLYSYVRCRLFQSYGPVPCVVLEAYMKYAINLIEYFQDQCREIDQVQFICFIPNVCLNSSCEYDQGYVEMFGKSARFVCFLSTW